MEPALDGSLRKPRDFTDLLIGEVLDISKDEHLSMVVVELADRSLDELLHLQPFRHFVGPLHLARCRTSGDGALRLHLGQLVLVFTMLLGFSSREILDSIATVVGRHAIEPGRQAAFTPEIVDILENGNENFLGDVFGFLPIPEHSEDEVEDLILVGPDELRKGALVMLAETTNKYAFPKWAHGFIGGIDPPLDGGFDILVLFFRQGDRG